MIGLNPTKNYPLTCPEPLWDDWKACFTGDDLTVNDALQATMAREVLRTREDELDDDRRESYKTLIERHEHED